jgi:prophage antirepressor-like protein
MNNINVIDERKVLGFDFKVYGDADNPLFLAKDVAKWIEHNKPSEMILNVDNDEKLKAIISHSGQSREMWFLTEDGLYEVLMQSRKPIAKEFKKKVKEILKELRKGNQVLVNTGNNQVDLYTQLMQASMQAISQVLNQNMLMLKQDLKEEFRREKENLKGIITEQEIVHKNQMQEARNLIGFKSKNTSSLTKLLKARISMLKGYNISARDDYHYRIASERLFRKYNVWLWEEIPVHRYEEVHADIDSIEDLDDIYFN